MNNFIVLEEICQTQFSTILRCKNKTTRDIVVLKEIRQKKTEDAPSKEVLREILIMMNFTHPHIVKYNSVFVHKCQVVIEMEFCISSLSNVIKKISKPFYIGQVKKIVRSIALGIKFLHDHDIIHRDIKPGNIFIDENCVVKIGDFGSARISPQQKKENEVEEKKKGSGGGKEKKEKRPLTPGVGTKWYKAPEIIFGGKHYDKSVDIWSFGCLMAEMFLLEPLFPGSTDFEMINLIFSFIGFSKEDDKVLKPQLHINFRERPKDIFENTFDTAEKDSIDLMSKMLVANPNKRITVEEILQHPFLKNEESYMNCNLPI
jgi:serine/threonine protein kinase